MVLKGTAMRAYFFANSWLSGIQKGLQSAHVVAEMAQAEFAMEGEHDGHDNPFQEWAEKHKTIIILEGGTHANLLSICEVLERGPLCWSDFSEDEESLNKAMTCVGVIVPERIYEAARVVRQYKLKWVNAHESPCDKLIFNWEAILRHDEPDRPGGWSEHFSKWEVELIKLLNSCPLAR
jgi:hypothetical protein